MNWGSHLSAVLIIGLGLLLTVSSADVYQYIVRRDYDICDPKTAITQPNSIYLPSPESTTEIFADWSPLPNQPTDINCLLYIKTCNNCRIEVTSTGAAFYYPPCSVTVTPSDVPDDVCIPNCAYFYLFDADYRSQTSQVVTKSPLLYKTESKQLHVRACALNYNKPVNMTLRLTAKEKIREISDQTLLTHSFSSPYFPSPYAKNSELYTFKLHALEPYMIVILSFDDWMITPSSYFEFDGSKDILRVTGANDRPSIQSVGPDLNVTFYTGEPTSGQSSFLGFRATVKFIYNSVTVIKSSTACDQDISSEGGIIRLAIADGQLRDCIFLIRKMSKFDGVYLRVLKTSIDDQSDYYDYSFDILGGITSKGDLKLQVYRNDPVLNTSFLRSSDGFYIRYKGRYYAGPSHVLAYSMYIVDCDDYGGYFRCKNDFCISLILKCDGYDHCGDGSDEYASLCSYETTHSSSSYPIGIGVIVPLVVSIFLIIVMCVLIILIRRCRRLNNAARSRRPPGARSNRQRSRHNRDVQMSVTVRSGEHPPSYDEVLQNTPIGYLNMAFTWSQGNNLAQPPSYEEAVSPSSQQNGSIIITTTANNGIGREETNRNPHQTSATLLTTISASLDPRVEVSSSSSSDDAPDRFRQLDFSSSSDSSIENEHHLAPHSHNIDSSRLNTNLNKAGKDLDNDMGSLSSFPKYVNNDAQIVLGSPGSGKVNSEGQERIKPVINQFMDESDGNRNPNNAGENQFVKEVRDQYQSFSDLRNASNSREVQGLPSSERFDDRSRGIQNHTMSGSEDFRNAERESKQGRVRVDMYHKNKGKHSHQNVDTESQGTYGIQTKVQPPKVSDSSRSQSCFDLSLGAGAVKLLEGGSAAMRNEDKRFSYAGAGDTSLVREGLGQFYNGRGLIREKPLEHLDRCASQYYDNVSDGNTLRKHNKTDYETRNEQDEDQQHRPRQSSNPTGHFPKGTRDKTDSLRAKGQYSSLAPVTENLYDEAYIPDSIPEATDRHMYTERTDKLKNPPTNNNWPQHRRNPLESGRGSSQAHALSSQKTNPESQGPSREHLLPGSSRSWPAKTMAMTPGHNYVHSHDHRKPTCDKRSREEAENWSSRNNSDIQNLNANSSKSIARSAMQDVASNSRGNGSTEYNKVPQSDQDTAASMFRPKPSLRKSRTKNAQRLDGPESLPNRSSQGHTQTSQRPVPAPRHGIQKPESVDARRPQPDAQHEWSMQGTNKVQNGQNERRDGSCPHTTDQVNSRGHINVEATNDDVFV